MEAVEERLRLLKEEMARALLEKKRRLDRNKLACYRPYPKLGEFHDCGARYSECLFMAGNQIGKEIDVVVSSVLQNSAGRMIFGRLPTSPAPIQTPMPTR